MDTTHHTPPTTAPAEPPARYEGLFLEPRYPDGQTWADHREDQEALEAA